jgi:nudix-type nucleoside diphosphatase (YffH/AdpP family)
MPFGRPKDSVALRDIVLGPDQSPQRLAFYCAVLGIDAVGLADDCDLGPGGPEAAALAQAIMAMYGHADVAAVRRRLSAMKVAAASRVRAAQTTIAGLRQGTGEVAVQKVEQGFAGFFAVEVANLSYRRFDGAMSQVIQREVFISGDAVTVLPYDPRRDRVLVIEQMRMGPMGRGDPLPWQIEAIAGRIDPGESPEDCARREAVEEAGLNLGRLEKVGEYYPSPGAVSEYLYSYVALCELPDDVAGVFGEATEAEDIRGILLSFDELIEALARGDIANAPLMLTALWLQRERRRLQGGT